MGNKARAVPQVDPLLQNQARADSAAPENLDDAVIAPLSELLAYAPPTRVRSSTSQARAVADDPHDRMPLFLERDGAADDDGFHFKQREPAHQNESRQDFRTADPPAHWFEPEVQEAPTDFARPGFFRYAAWAVTAAFAITAIFGAALFFGGASFNSLRSEVMGMKQVAQAATAPKQAAISFDQTFAAISPPTQPESKPETSGLGSLSRMAQGNTVGIATHDVKLQTDRSEERAPAPPTAADLPRRIDQAELANLLKRGRELIDVGDIASARLLLRRAADAREPQAAFALAGTYDPAVLGRVKAYGIAPDPAMARSWYEKAKEFGSPDAQRRLEQLPK